jgi:hypothetical protein
VGDLGETKAGVVVVDKSGSGALENVCGQQGRAGAKVRDVVATRHGCDCGCVWGWVEEGAIETSILDEKCALWKELLEN